MGCSALKGAPVAETKTRKPRPKKKGPFRSGFAAIVGRPNVGKSTLVNKLVGQKVAITSEKAQTTRHAIHGVVTTDEAQVVFVDTPGIHKPLHLLGEQIVKAATDTLDDVDVRVFLVDAQEPAGKGDQFIAELLKQSQKPTILVLNKVDRVKEVPDAIFQSYKALMDFDAVVPLSARTGRNTNTLIAQIVKRLPEGPRYYEEDVPTDQTLRTLAGELIREQILRQTSEEIPHSVAVYIDEFDETASPPHIRATIFVERDSQKGIVIGDKGVRLKEIGQKARLAIEDQMGEQVFLDLWVKVLKNWRKDKPALKRLGYIVD
jgi:GTP-binding protein Era